MQAQLSTRIQNHEQSHTSQAGKTEPSQDHSDTQLQTIRTNKHTSSAQHRKPHK